MKRRILSIIAIVLILLSVSCDSSTKRLEEGNINYNIYPYLEFELSYDSTYYIAYVVEGAKVTTISIPGEKHTDYGAMPVKVFGGFRNPEDSKNLETVYIDINVDKIADDAFEYAENLEEIIVTGAEEGSNWTKLPPSLKRKGYHFEGWKVVEGRSNRKYTDEEAVAFKVKDAGFDPYEKKLLGVTAMSTLLGKKKFEELLGGLIYKLPGKPALVPESDKRPAMNTAIEDFNE